MIREIEWLNNGKMSDLIRFKQLIEENKKADEVNSKLDKFEVQLYGLTKYIFNLSYSMNTFLSPNVQLITLDESDIDYFYNKYVVGNLEKEMEEKINQIKKQYGK